MAKDNRTLGRFILDGIPPAPRGDLIEAAANLFSALQRLDDSGGSVIYAQAVTETGLGLAIMDRLRKASAPAEN